MALGRRKQVVSSAPSTDSGERIYAIGDIHGRRDLMRALLDRVEAHFLGLPRCRSMHIVLLGDMIDRGPDSAKVLKFAFETQKKSDRLVVLRGNHEDLMLRAMEGEPGMMRAWQRLGGDQTMMSFGVEPPQADADTLRATRDLLAAVPRDMVEWMQALPLTAQSGDYLFCHAGIRPGVPIRRQSRKDLLWIRDDFLNDTSDHGAVVVHGHSISAEVEMRPNRIGIDTGAYRTGVLTALYLEEADREIISVGPADVEQSAAD